MKNRIIEIIGWFLIGISSGIVIFFVLEIEAHGQTIGKDSFSHETITVEKSGIVFTSPVFLTGVRLSSKNCNAIFYDGVMYKYTIKQTETYWNDTQPFVSLTIGIVGVGETPGGTCTVEIDYFR